MQRYPMWYATRAKAQDECDKMREHGWPTARVVKDDEEGAADARYCIMVGVSVLCDDGFVERLL